MKRILDSRKLFNVDQNADLSVLKVTYRNLMKEWHPDKFQVNDEQAEMAAEKSKHIIEAYHFLVSISPETHAQNSENYTQTTSTSGIDDFSYKGQTLKVTFQDGSVYEYFGVPKKIYGNLISTPIPARFARRHIFHSYLHRNIKKSELVEA